MPGLDAFIGQEPIKVDLRSRIRNALEQGTALPHILLCAPVEMGKSTLAIAIAEEMGRPTRHVDPQPDLREGDVAALLTALDEHDLLSFSEIQSVSKSLLYEKLLSAITKGSLELTIGTGPQARSMSIPLKPFTLIATTSRPSQIERRLRRWMVVYDFAPYSVSEMTAIVAVLGERLDPRRGVDQEAAHLLAQHSEGSPGNATVLLRRLTQATRAGHLTAKIVEEVLTSFGYLGRPLSSVDLAEKVRAMDGGDFERFVAGVFRERGFAVEVTQQSRDHGIDLLMRRSDRGNIAVQCKCWSSVVGEPTLRDFYGAMMNAGIPQGYVVAAGPFSADASAFAEHKAIRLVDLDGLLALKLYGKEP